RAKHCWLSPFSRLRGKVPGGRMGGALASVVALSNSKIKIKIKSFHSPAGSKLLFFACAKKR
ncbi:hypothetical protein, partial [Stenotrophomonas sp.]|uniref:hypothetical protein n=1 Tax=Stenotrophomonas sp. TaxID=69392 RepID=UPI0028AB9FCB